MAQTRYVGCLENVVVPPRDFFAHALDLVSRAGMHTRLGLTPSRTARLWRWNGDHAPAIHDLPTDVADRGTAAVLEYIRRLPIARRPVDVYLSERHIAFDIDHGLGDARLYIDCVTALFEIQQGTAPDWLRNRDTANPLARAVINTFGSSPRRLKKTWVEARELPNSFVGESAEPSPASWSASHAVEVVRIDAELEREVELWRAANAPAASRALIWLVITHTALARAGLPVPDSVRLIVDCRRYLRSDDRVNANFISGLAVLAPADQTLGAIGAAVREDLDAALPLLALTATSVRNLLIGARPKPTTAGAPTQLVYSDIGRVHPFEKLPWQADRPRTINASLEPGGPSDISIFSGIIGRERSITFSYHDNVHDRGLMRAAAESLSADAVSLLR